MGVKPTLLHILTTVRGPQHPANSREDLISYVKQVLSVKPTACAKEFALEQEWMI